MIIRPGKSGASRVTTIEDKLRELLRQQAEEIEKLKLCLAFYADEATYDIDHLSKHGYIIIDKDNGRRARTLLAELDRKDTQPKKCEACKGTGCCHFNGFADSMTPCAECYGEGVIEDTQGEGGHGREVK